MCELYKQVENQAFSGLFHNECKLIRDLLTMYIYYTPTRRERAILQSPCPSILLSVRLLVHPSVCPSVHTFVTDISASTRRNDCTSTSCLLCDLQMNEWGYSQHDLACNILLCLSCNVKKSKTTAKLSEKSRNKCILIVFNGVLCDVRAYTVTVFYCSSTQIRHQKTLLCP